MGRLLLLLLLGFLIYLMVKGFTRSSARRKKAEDSAPKLGEQMVTCDYCGVHLPESDSVSAGDKHFCTEDHRRLGG